MEQCRQGKSAKWIRNLGKRIGSEGWARGSLFRTRRLSVDCSSCFQQSPKQLIHLVGFPMSVKRNHCKIKHCIRVNSSILTFSLQVHL
ncbi:unnamed protein product [Linum tenue]|uniref:Uncharacterized protein n=1 Tax=Linum tenue TaxID=586396 RepID=A0AAV0LB79_9ROSI|nr:unnamed protein product [Linum tenue]